MEMLGFVACVFMGLSLGIIGGGGSILTVPILVYFFAIPPMLATSYSLFSVGSTALVGSFFYIQRGEVDLKTGLRFAIPSFLSLYVTRRILIPLLPDPVILVGSFILTKALLMMVFFAILMLMASVSMIRANGLARKVTSGLMSHHFWKIVLQGLAVGFVTGAVGAGGGFLIVPTLVLLVGLPMRQAVGTSLLVIATNSLLGFLGDFQSHIQLNWKLLFGVSGIAIGGLLVGIHLNKHIPEKQLKKGFGIFVLVMGTLILLDQLRNLKIAT